MKMLADFKKIKEEIEMESLATILSPEEKECRAKLARTESELREEYSRLQSLAYDFWARAQTVKAEMEILESERLEREKAAAKVIKISQRTRNQGRTPEAEKIYQKAMKMAEEIMRKKKERKNV